jgi:hypothetical protein
MSAKDHLSPNQFHQFKGYDLLVNPGDESHNVEAYKEKYGPIGHFEWAADTGKVLDIKVTPEHQRQGLATKMWDLAHNSGLTKPVHSSERTPEGDAWAKSVGGKLPAVKKCTACGEVGHLASENLC